MAEDTSLYPVEPRVTDHNPAQRDTASERTVRVQENPAALPKLDDEPPDGGYGWVCVACNFFINGKNTSRCDVSHSKSSTKSGVQMLCG